MQSRIKMYYRAENTPSNVANAAVKYSIQVAKTFNGLKIDASYISGVVRGTRERFHEIADYDQNLNLLYGASGSAALILSDHVMHKYSELFQKLRPLREIGFKMDKSYVKMKSLSKQIYIHAKGIRKS